MFPETERRRLRLVRERGRVHRLQTRVHDGYSLLDALRVCGARAVYLQFPPGRVPAVLPAPLLPVHAYCAAHQPRTLTAGFTPTAGAE